VIGRPNDDRFGPGSEIRPWRAQTTRTGRPCAARTAGRIRRCSATSSAPVGHRFTHEVIALAVRWYLRYGLSFRDVEELLAERGKYRKTKVDFIYPSLDNDNRNFKFRALIDNPNHTLKPGQSAEVWVQAQARKALAIPVNALLDSGREQWVLVAASPGIYQPRKVQVGERNLDWIEIISGVEDGEQVVTNANFLIDSESRLQSALTNFEQSSAAHQEKSPTTTPSGMEH